MKRRWSEDEELYLERYCYEPEEDIEDVAKFLGRTPASVASKLSRMRTYCDVYVPRKLRRYTKKEIEYIKKMYSSVPAAEIAKVLNRPVGSVMEKARQLNIRKQTSLKKYDVEIRKLAKLGKTTVEIGLLIGISDRQVADYCYRNSIDFKRISNQERNNRKWRKVLFMK